MLLVYFVFVYLSKLLTFRSSAFLFAPPLDCSPGDLQQCDGHQPVVSRTSADEWLQGKWIADGRGWKLEVAIVCAYLRSFQIKI